jgi:hypothetical protein
MKVSLDETIQRFGRRLQLIGGRSLYGRSVSVTLACLNRSLTTFGCSLAAKQQRRTCGETKTTIVLSVGSWQHGELPKLRAVEEKTTQLAFGSCVRVVCQLSRRRSN